MTMCWDVSIGEDLYKYRLSISWCKMISIGRRGGLAAKFSVIFI